MTTTRPFRFIATMPKLNQPAAAWRDAVRRIEDSGFSTVSVSDHFTKGWVMEPTIAMMAAANETRRLRVLSLVLGNDYRHPVLLHKAMATIDVLSEGRLEVGLGAGWMISDYQAAGIAYDPPGRRVERLAESVRVLKALFGPSPATLIGDHYRITALDGFPKPVQQPHPPLLIGGGGKRVLSFAAAEADIVGFHANLRAGAITHAAVADLSAERFQEKVGWVRGAVGAAGRSMDDIELQLTLYVSRITAIKATAQASVSSFAAHLNADPTLLERSPAVLCGSLEHCVEQLQQRREQYGFSYINLGGDVEATAPLVARLAGT